MIIIKQAKTKEEFEQMYDLRWKILRKPWDQPRVDDEDGLEDKSIHIIAVDDSTNKVVGCGRLHKRSSTEGQIRYMAVEKSYQGKGIGKLILDELHSRAKALGFKKIILNARENVVDFYKKYNYKVMGKGHTLFGVIKHYKMEYTLE